VEGGKSVARMYFMKEESIFKRKKERKKKGGKGGRKEGRKEGKADILQTEMGGEF
jgi:hypothetical protein